jgi:putative addiction module component (TIGR02574 family)
MNKSLLKEALELTPTERVEFVGEIWDSIAPHDMPPLTDEQKQDIERRYEAMVNDPSRGSKWDDVEAGFTRTTSGPMNKALLKELMELSPEERIQLAEDLWDSIAQDELPPLTDAQKKEIDRRIEEHERDPSTALPWEDVRKWLWSNYK